MRQAVEMNEMASRKSTFDVEDSDLIVHSAVATYLLCTKMTTRTFFGKNKIKFL